jgi:hypothetical protein
MGEGERLAPIFGKSNQIPLVFQDEGEKTSAFVPHLEDLPSDYKLGLGSM